MDIVRLLKKRYDTLFAYLLLQCVSILHLLAYSFCYNLCLSVTWSVKFGSFVISLTLILSTYYHTHQSTHILDLVLTMSLTLLSVDQIADLSSHFKPDGPADKKSKKMQDEKTARQTAQGDLSITIHYYTMCSLNCLSGYIDMIYSHSHIFSILLLSLLLL